MTTYELDEDDDGRIVLTTRRVVRHEDDVPDAVLEEYRALRRDAERRRGESEREQAAAYGERFAASGRW